MQSQKSVMVEPATTQHRLGQRISVVWRPIVTVLAVAVIIFLALYNLTDYPLTWFDEGSHLHVPKTLVRFGVYADYSSEGFRYYGPTLGVGPTVMLPIAAAFRLFGVGLLQARLVMAVYLLVTLYAFYRLAYRLGGRRLAWMATILLISSRGVGILLYGRQVLGEVPGLFFLVVSLELWFAAWERAGWRRLALVGLLLGLAMVTKYQYLLFLAPTLGLAWLANLVYYRVAPHRLFIAPGLAAAACFALWQTYLILYLGPATAGENLATLREASAGAALSFSPQLMAESLFVVLSPPVYLGSLLLVLAYGFFLALPRRRVAQQWSTLLILIVINLGWYIVASVGWWRYAFPGMAMASLFVARFFCDLTDGFRLGKARFWEDLRRGKPILRDHASRWALLVWLAVMIALPLAESFWEIWSPDFNSPVAMAAYLNEHIPTDVLIETWEPEMGFLTDHNYHFPPTQLLTNAVRQAFLDGPPVAQAYHFVQTERPAYVLIGEFGRKVQMYPPQVLAAHYELAATVGYYELYVRIK
jgi:4-amino-4-deoxy-L-arabinose transferase-like glycosyltransferase